MVGLFQRSRWCKPFHFDVRKIRVLAVLAGAPGLFSVLLLIRLILLMMSDLKWIYKEKSEKIYYILQVSVVLSFVSQFVHILLITIIIILS